MSDAELDAILDAVGREIHDRGLTARWLLGCSPEAVVADAVHQDVTPKSQTASGPGHEPEPRLR